MMMNQPNATLYIKNIDWKVKKGLLRRALYLLFSRYGKVLEVIALRKDGLRGQAFVLMDTIQAATAALQKEQGFTFFGKDLIIEYAKTKSDRIAKRDGDYIPKAKRIQQQQKQQTKHDQEEKEEEPPIQDDDANDDDDDTKQQQETNANAMTSSSNNQTKEEAKEPPGHHYATATAATTPTLPALQAVPSRMLLVQNLPYECNESILHQLFGQYTGYIEARIPRPGLAFVEFQDEPKATLAYQALQGFPLTQTDTLQLGYGKE